MIVLIYTPVCIFRMIAKYSMSLIAQDLIISTAQIISHKKLKIACAVKQQLLPSFFLFVFIDLLGMSHLDLLVQELTTVCDKWQYIGEKLGVNQFSLRRISTNHSDSGDCLREVLRRWLQSCAATWKHIVAVLRTPHIGDSHLADHLEAKYCSCELTCSSVETM